MMSLPFNSTHLLSSEFVNSSQFNETESSEKNELDISEFVNTEDLIIVLFILSAWVAMIFLFVNKWGKIRMLEPYQPIYRSPCASVKQKLTPAISRVDVRRPVMKPPKIRFESSDLIRTSSCPNRNIQVYSSVLSLASMCHGLKRHHSVTLQDRAKEDFIMKRFKSAENIAFDRVM